MKIEVCEETDGTEAGDENPNDQQGREHEELDLDAHVRHEKEKKQGGNHKQDR
jgi:hypothetical protein